MDPTILVITSILVLFVIMIVLLRPLGFRVCALCAAVSGTWILLLILTATGTFKEPLLIAILMGESAVGLMSLMTKRLPWFEIFRLPFLLTLTWIIARIVGVQGGNMIIISTLAVLWIITILIHATRHAPRVGAAWKRLAACCRNW